MPNWFENAGKRRESIVYTQKKQVLMMYRNLHKEVKNVLQNHKFSVNFVVPNYLKRVVFASVERDIKDLVDRALSEVNLLVKQNMRESAKAVMDDNADFLKEIGIDDELIEDFHDLDEDRIENIILMILSGQLYDKSWSLSGFLNKERDQIMADVHKIIEKCVEEEMTLDEIKKYISMYFNPDKSKGTDFFILFPGVRKKIFYYTLQTLTTLVGHSYEESLVNVLLKNPFVEGFRWTTSGSDKVCPVCIDRESTDKFGLGVGIFPKDKLPLDHPNGMCTFDPVYIMSTGEIVREIDLWKKGFGSMREKIDKWVKSFSKK